MEPCTRCGATDEHRMIALMSRWFAVHAGLALEQGYFYLCPACYDQRIAPGFEAIVALIREHQKPDRVAGREAAAANGASGATAEGAAPGGAAANSGPRRLAPDGTAPGDSPISPPPA